MNYLLHFEVLYIKTPTVCLRFIEQLIEEKFSLKH